MPNRADLAIYQGDDYNALVTVNPGIGPPDVIAGFTARAQIREDFADDCTDVAATIGTTVDSPLIWLKIPGADTSNLCGDYVWDLEITSPDGVVSTILAGKVKVSEEVTR